MPLIDITAPATEPITSAEVKAAARIDHAEFDTQIAIVIPAVRRMAEQILGRRLVTQTVELVLDAFPSVEIDLQLPDVQAISSVKYIADDTGTETTLASTEYSLDADSTPCWLLPSYDAGDWPTARDTTNAVRIRFTVGYGDAADVPGDIKVWMLAHACQMLSSPDGMARGDVKPMAFIDHLLDAHRVIRIG